jgi:hypothetical protein
VRAVFLVTVAMNTLFFPYQHMLPVFARDVLALGPAGLGALVAADGGGALLGALVIATRRGDLGYRLLFGAAVLVGPGPAGRALDLALAARVRDAARRDGDRRIRLRRDAEHARAPGGTRAPPGRGDGYPVGMHRHPTARHPGHRRARGELGTSLAFAVNALVSLLVIVPLAVPLVQRPVVP